MLLKKQAIDSGSVAGGQHLCFMGVGRDDEDKYVNMVVSNFLQRKINFVSLALGGYEELRRTIEDPEMIVGTELQMTRAKFTEDWVKKINVRSWKVEVSQPGSFFYSKMALSFFQSNESVINKFSNALKTKSFDFKGKLSNYLSTSITAAASTTAKKPPEK